MATQFVKSERLRKLPPYLFAEIDKKKKAAIAAGRDVINLGRRPRPADAAADHQEPPAPRREPGVPPVRARPGCPRAEAIDRGVLQEAVRPGPRPRDRDPAVDRLEGGDRASSRWPCSIPGDISLVPDPCYPVYRSSSMFAGADVYTMPLEPGLGFRPDLDAIPADVYALARLMFLNYPNNPTGGTADLGFFEKVVELAQAHDFVVAQDAAYNEMYFDEPPPASCRSRGPRTSRSSSTASPRPST